MKKLFALMIATLLLQACAGKGLIVMGDIPMTPKAYWQAVEKRGDLNKYELKKPFHVVEKNLHKVVKECYHYDRVVSELKSGDFQYRETFTGKVTKLNKKELLFTFQNKGKEGTSVYGDKSKIPKDGMWLYVIHFKPGANGKTIALAGHPWGWGSKIEGLLDATQFGFKKCPVSTF